MVDDLRQAESAASNNTAVNYTGSGKSGGGGESGSKLKSMMKYSAGIASGFLLVVIAVFVGITGTPIYMLRAADYGLQETSGVSGTDAILQEQAVYEGEEMLSDGKVPIKLADDMAKAGVTVGQVTAKGDFVRTNEYIADIDKLDDLAVVGSGFEMHGEDGELAVLFEGKVINGRDFADEAFSNPRLYAAFDEATNITVKYLYSDEAEKIFQDVMGGVKRNAYDAWRSTGDDEEDQKNFDEITKTVLNASSNVLGAYDCDDYSCIEATLSGDAKDIIGSMNNTLSSAQMANTVIASYEPYKAASAFMAIEMPIQLTVLDGQGPGNEVMNTMNTTIEVKITDVNSNEEVKIRNSIFDTGNFVSATSGGGFSTSEAANFRRDRLLKVTNSDDSAVSGTLVSSTGRDKSNVGVGIFSKSAEMEEAESVVQVALVDSNSDVFTSIIGGNRVVAGGPFLMNMVNQHVIGAMPSDESTVLAYSRDMKEALALKREAERATKSPFDITSPNTFMGSIVHGMATAMIRNHATTAPVSSALGTIVGYASDSANNLVGGAFADGGDGSFLETFGEGCLTPNYYGSAANLYCTDDNTIYTGYMKRTHDEWGDIGQSEGYKEWVKRATTRWVWGTTDTVACEDQGGIGILDFFNNFFGICLGPSADEKSGAKYVLSDDNKTIKKYSGYTLHNVVWSLLSEEKSDMSMILEDYYAEHPLDNSRAGIAARRSGLTKEQAQIALNRIDYLAYVAKYDASTRFAFGAVFEAPEKNELVDHSNKLGGELYCFRREGTEYGDLRGRNYTV